MILRSGFTAQYNTLYNQPADFLFEYKRKRLNFCGMTNETNKKNQKIGSPAAAMRLTNLNVEVADSPNRKIQCLI